MSDTARTVLVLASEHDAHSHAVCRHLEGRGLDSALLDLTRYPREVQVSMSAASPQLVLQLSNGRRLRGERVGAVWSRCRLRASADGDGASAPVLVPAKSRALLSALSRMLPVPWLDRPDVAAAASSRPVGALAARRLGFQVGQARAAETSSAPARRHPPATRKLRVVVVGDIVHACAVAPDDRPPRAVTATGEHHAVELPEPVAERCRAMIAALGLRFGGVQLLATADGRYVFESCDPASSFLHVEQRSGLPISASVAELLAHLACQHDKRRRSA